MDKDMPRLTVGICWLCDKIVNIHKRDETQGKIITVAGKYGFEHIACKTKVNLKEATKDYP